MWYLHCNWKVDSYTSVQHCNTQEVLCGYTNFQLLPIHTYAELLQLQKGLAVWQTLPWGCSQSARKQVLTQTVDMW